MSWTEEPLEDESTDDSVEGSQRRTNATDYASAAVKTPSTIVRDYGVLAPVPIYCIPSPPLCLGLVNMPPQLEPISLPPTLSCLVPSSPVPDLRGKLTSELNEDYPCHWLNCDRCFPHLDDLVNHVNDQHVKIERPAVDYQCRWNDCPRKGLGFNARYKMLIHIRTHTNEKPHRCDLCGKCFSRLENLKIHNRSHTGEKPYTCPVAGCGKAYSNSSDRFKHVRTHQEEKPYICRSPGCFKRYTDPSSLRKHIRTHNHYFCNGDATASTIPQCTKISKKLVTPHIVMLSQSQLTTNHIQPNFLPVQSDFVSDGTLLSSIFASPQTALVMTSELLPSVISHSMDKTDCDNKLTTFKLKEEFSLSQEGPLDLSCTHNSEKQLIMVRTLGS